MQKFMLVLSWWLLCFLFPLLMYFPLSIFHRLVKWAVSCTQQNTSASINHEKVNYTSFCELLWSFIISLVSDMLKSPPYLKNPHVIRRRIKSTYTLCMVPAPLFCQCQQHCLKINKHWLADILSLSNEIMQTTCVPQEKQNWSSSSKISNLTATSLT